MKAVNLLPLDRAADKAAIGVGPIPLKLLGPLLGVVMVVATAALAIGVWTSNSNLTTKQKELAALQTTIATLPASSAPVVLMTSATPPRKVDLVSLASARLPWDGFLGAFARVVPENVWLSTLQANTQGAALTVAQTQAAEAAALNPPPTSSGSSNSSSASTTSTPAPPAPSTPSTFTITGFTYSQPSVARLMRRLALIPWLANVDLVSSTSTLINNSKVYQFVVGANVIQLPRDES